MVFKFSQEEKGGKKSKNQKLAKEFSRCVNYVCSVGFKGFEHAKQNCKWIQVECSPIRPLVLFSTSCKNSQAFVYKFPLDFSGQ